MIRIKRLYKSFNYAFRGLYKAFREEQNLRVQSTLGMMVLVFAWLFQIDIFEWIIIILLIGIVLLMELINSAVERVSDVLKPRIDNYVKEIKDIMAAAVMLASIISIVIGLIIFFPYFNNFLF